MLYLQEALKMRA